MNDQLTKQQADADRDATIGKFFEHMTSALTSSSNFKTEEAQYSVGQMQILADKIDGKVKALVDLSLNYVREFVTGNSLLATADSGPDIEKALEHLVASRNSTRSLREQFPDVGNTPDFFQMAHGLEMQVVSIQARLARLSGNGKEAARLEAQMISTTKTMVEALEPGAPLRHMFEGLLCYQEALPKVGAALNAVSEMNLDLAQHYLREASELYSAMDDHLRKAPTGNAMLQAVTQVTEGFRLFSKAQDTYVNTLRSAILGDVSRNDVERLNDAERNALQAAQIIAKGVAAAPGFFANLDMQPYANALATLVRNLRALAERSLTPKAISQSASPRAVVYFVGTFVVLLLALPISGLVKELTIPGVGILLMVSLAISLIGAFGFESIRLLPFFDALARFMPGAGSSGKAEPKKPASKLND